MQALALKGSGTGESTLLSSNPGHLSTSSLFVVFSGVSLKRGSSNNLYLYISSEKKRKPAPTHLWSLLVSKFKRHLAVLTWEYKDHIQGFLVSVCISKQRTSSFLKTQVNDAEPLLTLYPLVPKLGNVRCYRWSPTWPVISH